MRRFLIAAGTYTLGLAILALCSAFGLFAWAHLAWVATGFVLANALLYATFRTGSNLRFKDPSLTFFQNLVSATLVIPVWVLGPHLQAIAIPFYSAMFMFAMLQSSRRQLALIATYMTVSYSLAVGLRLMLSTGPIDLGFEVLHAALVGMTSVWYTLAAGYISDLRSRLRESIDTVKRMASRDALTQIWNRGHMDSLLNNELDRFARHGQPLSVCIADLDHFKSINDRFGHPVGDAVLRDAAQALSAQIRTTDHLGRFGGEEFLILLPGSTLGVGAACAERLRAGVATLATLREAGVDVTASFGVAQAVPGEQPQALLARADAALYRAKHMGRNRIEVAASTDAASTVD